MAILFEDESRRVECDKCKCRRIYKRDVFTYLVDPKHKDFLEEHLIETELCCGQCYKVLRTIKPGAGQDTIIR